MLRRRRPEGIATPRNMTTKSNLAFSTASLNRLKFL